MSAFSNGKTPSERYLSGLCKRAFLSLWSYPNLHTDEGRKKGKGVGHELCDLLVVFENDVIIFSDKYVTFNEKIDVKSAWRRWYKKAVVKSANQVYGAESWLRKHPERIYLDAHCQHKLPVELPAADSFRVHRICVAHGVYNACKDYFGGNSLGSLVVNSGIQGADEHNQPFHVGAVNPEKGFVHVFEDFTLDAVFTELDTIADFIAYLNKRENFLTKEKLTILAPGEEQLLAIYLTHINSDGEHDFVLSTGDNDEPDFISFDESFWDSMVQNPQYRAKKEADKISYAWDRLIEHFIKHGRNYDDTSQGNQTTAELEWGLRFMASEPRIRRRQLAHAIVHLLENTPQGKRATRVVYSNDFPEYAYVFLVLPKLEDENYEEYRINRNALLLAYCKVTKLRCQTANYIIGLATENYGAEGASEDLAVLDVREWTDEMQEEAKYIRNEASLLLDENISVTEGRAQEYPDIPSPSNAYKDAVKKREKRATNRKRMQKTSRKRNRKK